MRRRVTHDHDAAVVGNVQPLVPVGRPRIGVRKAGDEPAIRGRGGGPQAEGSVDVQPRAVLARELADFDQRIARAGVHVPDLRTDNRRTRRRRQRPLERVGPHASLLVGRDAHDRAAADTNHPARGVDRGVRFFAGDNRQRRGALQPERFDVPPGAAKHFVPGGGERGDVGRVRAGHEPDARLFGQSEHIENPARGARFERRHARRHDVQRGVLIPGRDEPVRRQRDRIAAARDEAEIARPGRRRDARLEPRAQVEDDADRVLGRLGERPAEGGHELLEGGPGRHGPVGQRVEELHGPLVGVRQQVIWLRHGGCAGLIGGGASPQETGSDRGRSGVGPGSEPGSELGSGADCC